VHTQLRLPPLHSHNHTGIDLSFQFCFWMIRVIREIRGSLPWFAAQTTGTQE
jgi:hypothetical protein